MLKNTLKQNIMNGKNYLNKIILGSIITTMLCHSFCCILPLVGFMVGFNIIGAVMHSYEWVYIILNIISIIVGFYITYFHKKKKNCDHTHCNNSNVNTYWIATSISIVTIIVLHVII